jgi:hypothetical protein
MNKTGKPGIFRGLTMVNPAEGQPLWLPFAGTLLIMAHRAPTRGAPPHHTVTGGHMSYETGKKQEYYPPSSPWLPPE